MQVNVSQLALVAIGGMLGSVLRFLSGLFIIERFHTSYPWPTFVINIIGSFLIGIVMGYFGKSNGNVQLLSNENWRILLASGFCGGFTTFSAFSNESYQLIKQQQYAFFFVYFTTSVIFGVIATTIGYITTR